MQTKREKKIICTDFIFKILSLKQWFPNYELRLVLPGRMWQKAGQGDKENGTEASKTGHKNTVKGRRTFGT